jgi:hypothetical protein
MTVAFAELMAAEPATYGYAADAWILLRDAFDAGVTDFSDNVLKRVGDSGWIGGSAYSAYNALLTGLGQLAATSQYVEGVTLLLGQAAVGIAEAQGIVLDAVADATAAGLEVDADGVVTVPADVVATPAVAATATDVRTRIATALAKATDVAETVAAGLSLAYKFTTGAWLRDAYADLEHVRGTGAALVYEYGDGGLDGPLRPWGVADPGLRDQWLHLQMMGAAAGLEATGRPHAASLLKHWLDNSGEPVELSPAEMMGDIPAFRAEVEQFVAAQGAGAFDSGWANGDWLNETRNRATSAEQDWYYSLNDFRWRVVGVSDGAGSVQYTVEIYKNWQFNPDRTPISIPHTPIDYEQERLMHLHEVGLSRDFVVTGSSTFSE